MSTTLSSSPPPTDARLPLLWLCGAPGSGKSATGWGLFQRHADNLVGYVDIDQLSMLFPEPDGSRRLTLRNLAALAGIHRRLGTRALVVSGVLDPDAVAEAEQHLADECDLTWCLMDATDDDLRERVGSRGWPDELLDRVLDEAKAWREVGLPARIDTSSVRPDQAATLADDLLRLRDEVPPEPIPEPEDCPALMVVFGARAVGKSTLSWQLFMECAGRQEPTGYLDADQLGFLHADPGLRDDLVFHAVTRLASSFAGAGALRTIVNGNLSPRLAAALAGDRTTLVQLDAPQLVVADRIAGRFGEGPARLAGDDLVDADAARRTIVLGRSLEQRAALREADLPGHRIDVGGVDQRWQMAALDALLPDRRQR